MMIKTIMNDPLIIIERDIPDKTIFFFGVSLSGHVAAWPRPTQNGPRWHRRTPSIGAFLQEFSRGTKKDWLSEWIMEHLTMIVMKWIGWFRGTPIGKPHPIWWDMMIIHRNWVCAQFSNKAMCHWAIFILPIWKTWPMRHNLSLECWFLSPWG